MFFLDTIALKDDYEKDQFFKRLQPLIQALPVEVSRFKVLVLAPGWIFWD